MNFPIFRQLQEAYKDYMWHVAYLLSHDANVTISRDVIDQFVEDAYYQEYTIAQVRDFTLQQRVKCFLICLTQFVLAHGLGERRRCVANCHVCG